ncbi:MAG: globin [Burkholderiaceae bacterium]|nr:globin [Burkholderiaceae bacterium]
MTDDATLLEQALEGVVERIGDPAPRVYARLFERWPDLPALFVGDPRGSVRGEMFQRVVESLLDLAQGRDWAGALIATERVNHAGLGVSAQQFEDFFEVMAEVCREALGPGWTGEIDGAWRRVVGRAMAA